MSIYRIAKETVVRFMDNGGSLLSAALAFYAILSLAPLALVAISVAGLVFGEAAASGQLRDGLSHYLGVRNADVVAGLVTTLKDHTGGKRATVIGVVLLLWGATRLFNQVQDALNQLWRIRTEFKSFRAGVLTTVIKKLQSMLMVLVVGGFLGALILLGTIASTTKQLLGDSLPGSSLVWVLASAGTTAVLVTLLFTLTYRLMPDANLAWRDAIAGATFASVLFVAAEYPLNFYLSHQGVESAYGAAGSLVLLLLWVYYSAHLFFLGAQLSRVLADSSGRSLEPDPMAVLVHEVPVETRAQKQFTDSDDSSTAARDARRSTHERHS